MDRREYVCNQMYKQHDLLRKGSWTDADKLEYMELGIAPYSTYWRMGMKKALKHAIRLLREEEAKADRKTESNSEKPNNCTDCECTDDCSECKEAEHGCKNEPQTDCDGCKHYADEYTADACYECKRSYTDRYEPQTEEEMLREQCRAFMDVVKQTERSE